MQEPPGGGGGTALKHIDKCAKKTIQAKHIECSHIRRAAAARNIMGNPQIVVISRTRMTKPNGICSKLPSWQRSNIQLLSVGSCFGSSTHQDAANGGVGYSDLRLGSAQNQSVRQKQQVVLAPSDSVKFNICCLYSCCMNYPDMTAVQSRQKSDPSRIIWNWACFAAAQKRLCIEMMHPFMLAKRVILWIIRATKAWSRL